MGREIAKAKAGTMVDRKCECCGKQFVTRRSNIAKGWGKYCSKKCKAVVQSRRGLKHTIAPFNDDTYDGMEDFY